MTGTNNATAGHEQDNFLDNAFGVLDAAQDGLKTDELAGVVANATEQGEGLSPLPIDSDLFTLDNDDETVSPELKEALLLGEDKPVDVNDSVIDWDSLTSGAHDMSFEQAVRGAASVDDGEFFIDSDLAGAEGNLAGAGITDLSDDLQMGDVDQFIEQGVDSLDFSIEDEPEAVKTTSTTASDEGFKLDDENDDFLSGAFGSDESKELNSVVSSNDDFSDESKGDFFDDLLAGDESSPFSLDGDEPERISTVNNDENPITNEFSSDGFLSEPTSNTNTDFDDLIGSNDGDDFLANVPSNSEPDDIEPSQPFLQSPDADLDDFGSDIAGVAQGGDAPVVTQAGGLDSFLAGASDEWDDNLESKDPISDWAAAPGESSESIGSSEDAAIRTWAQGASVADEFDSIIGDDLAHIGEDELIGGEDVVNDELPKGIHANPDAFAEQLATLPISSEKLAEASAPTMAERGSDVPEYQDRARVEHESLGENASKTFTQNDTAQHDEPLFAEQAVAHVPVQPKSRWFKMGWPVVTLVSLSLSCAMMLFAALPDLSPFKLGVDSETQAKLSSLEIEVARLREDISTSKGLSQRVSDFTSQLDGAKGKMDTLSSEQQLLSEDLSRVREQMSGFEQNVVSRMGTVVNLVAQFANQQTEQSQLIKDTVLREALSIMENKDAPSAERLAELEKLTLEMQRHQEKQEAILSSQRQVTSFLEADVEYLKKQAKSPSVNTNKSAQNFEQKIMNQPLPAKKTEASVVVTPSEPRAKTQKAPVGAGQVWHVVGAHAKSNGEYDIYLQPENDSSPAAIKDFVFGQGYSDVIPGYGKILGVRRIENSDMVVPYVISTERGEIRGRR